MIAPIGCTATYQTQEWCAKFRQLAAKLRISGNARHVYIALQQDRVNFSKLQLTIRTELDHRPNEQRQQSIRLHFRLDRLRRCIFDLWTPDLVRSLLELWRRFDRHSPHQKSLRGATPI